MKIKMANQEQVMGHIFASMEWTLPRNLYPGEIVELKPVRGTDTVIVRAAYREKGNILIPYEIDGKRWKDIVEEKGLPHDRVLVTSEVREHVIAALVLLVGMTFLGLGMIAWLIFLGYIELAGIQLRSH